MNADRTGGPAFPLVNDGEGVNEKRSFVNYGMTLWDYFAAHVPSANQVHYLDANGLSKTGKELAEAQAYWAAEFADAMMAERNKRGIK